jgi:hypothetical protein
VRVGAILAASSTTAQLSFGAGPKIYLSDYLDLILFDSRFAPEVWFPSAKTGLAENALRLHERELHRAHRWFAVQFEIRRNGTGPSRGLQSTGRANRAISNRTVPSLSVVSGSPARLYREEKSSLIESLGSRY